MTREAINLRVVRRHRRQKAAAMELSFRLSLLSLQTQMREQMAMLRDSYLDRETRRAECEKAQGMANVH